MNSTKGTIKMNAISRDKLRAMYSIVGPFIEEMARARLHNKEFHIHPNGNPVYHEKYDWVGPFVGGFALVGNGNPGCAGEWFKIDKTGKVSEKGSCQKWSFCPEGIVIRIGDTIRLNWDKVIHTGSFESWEIGTEGLAIKNHGGKSVYCVRYDGR